MEESSIYLWIMLLCATPQSPAEIDTVSVLLQRVEISFLLVNEAPGIS